MNTIYGYWRCSTDAQDQERQIRSLNEAGCEKVVGDFITGTSNYGDRKELSKLLDEIQEGSLLILDELNRLGRTMVTMLVEVNKLLEKGVKIRTLDGRLDTTTMNKEIINLIVGVMGYSAEMELSNIRRRTEEEIAEAKSVKLEDLKDPQKDEDRAKDPEWLVMLGVCTHLGCVPLDQKGDYNGWFCPCHGSHYDISGRIRKGPAPTNMEIPKYEFVNANTIKIG